jgi:pimeloyl-ACP methyl ester carboxylesterase
MPDCVTFLLDGIWGRPRRFARIGRAIEATSGPTQIFRYDHTGIGCLQEQGNRLAQEIRRCGKPVNIVAFSMGGLVARAAKLADPGLPIRRAVFLNSPHYGSIWCYLAWPFKKLQGMRQMIPGSVFLQQLQSSTWNIPTLSVWCPLDLAVVPGNLAKWPTDGQTIRSAVPLHPWPIYSPALRRKIAAFLAEAEPNHEVTKHTKRNKELPANAFS